MADTTHAPGPRGGREAGQGCLGTARSALGFLACSSTRHMLHYAEAEIRSEIDLPAASKTTEASPVLALDQSSAEDVCVPTQPPPEAQWARALLLLCPDLLPALLQTRQPLPSKQGLRSPGAQEPGFQFSLACLLCRVFLVSGC